jgi:hypothetical protein
VVSGVPRLWKLGFAPLASAALTRFALKSSTADANC